MRSCGTYSGYIGGCRCSSCCEANTAKSRAYRANPAAKERDRIRAVAYRAANPNKIRESHLLRKYGITIADRDALLLAQRGVCAICASPDFGDRGPQVDHVHDSTRRVRGVLCLGCNVGLGALAEDPARLRAAADYIEHHQATPTMTVDEHW